MVDKFTRQSVLEYFQVPDDIKTLGRLASWDLLCGPLTFCETCGVDSLNECKCAIKYPGFSAAANKIGDWVDDNVTDLYVDVGGYVTSQEPDCTSEDGVYLDPDDFWTFLDKTKVTEILFSRELAMFLK